MDSFGFIIHPLAVEDVMRSFPFFSRWRPDVLSGLMSKSPPLLVDHLQGIRSAHNEIEGWFVATLLTAKQMVELPLPYVLRKIIAAAKKLEKQGARVIGLGAMTAVVGDAGKTIAKQLRTPVTTGNSYTVATAVQATLMAAKEMGKALPRTHLVVVGATGSIGSVCARMLAPCVGKLTLVARDEAKLADMADALQRDYGTTADISLHAAKAVRRADLVITVSSSPDALFRPADLPPGAVVCDVARPRDVARQVAEEREDVLVIEGGLVEVPGDFQQKLHVGLPPGIVYACMAETMILALERRYECFTLGRQITWQQVREIERLAEKHGFRLAALRSNEKLLTREEIAKVRRKAEERSVRSWPIPQLT